MVMDRFCTFAVRDKSVASELVHMLLKRHRSGEIFGSLPHRCIIITGRRQTDNPAR